MSEPATHKNHGYGREQVVQIINSVISKVENNETVSKDAIFQELRSLQQIIEDARKEIGMARPTDIKDKHIPTATDELDAVVEATAEATGTIMDVCDKIQEYAAAASGEYGTAIEGEVIKIYEACSFQDITGQRITKVVSTIKTIEEKVDKLVKVLSQQLPGHHHEEDTSGGDDDTRQGDERLLNGPQMADQAISQDEIDKLLSEFD